MGCSSSSAKPAAVPPSSLAVTVAGERGLTSSSPGEQAQEQEQVMLGEDSAAPAGSETDSAQAKNKAGKSKGKKSSPADNALPLPVWNRSNAERACFGAGCYWGTEKFFKHDFAKKYVDMGTIHEGSVGFMGPPSAPANPSYQDVCGGGTGHVEVYDFLYSGGDAYFRECVKFFFQFHDPTTLDRQGNDQGSQYASVIYCYSQRQAEIAREVKAELQALLDAGKIKGYKDKQVVTDIRTATTFYAAQAEHQNYLVKNPNGYCNHRIRFALWPATAK